MVESFKVTIDQFDGPLDLMLHLIHEKKMDIFNLNLSELADQYIAYLDEMEKLHLEIASEYLTELAQLVEYKSKKLLPRDTSELDDNYEEDTRERLVQRLLEYQRFKEVSNKFQELSEERALQFDKPESDIANYYRQQSAQDQLTNDGTMAELLRAMNQCIKRYRILQPLPVSFTRREVSAEERTETIRGRLKELPENFWLEDLCTDCPDVYLVIVTFLSVLELMKNGELVAHVTEGRIALKRGANYGQ